MNIKEIFFVMADGQIVTTTWVFWVVFFIIVSSIISMIMGFFLPNDEPFDVAVHGLLLGVVFTVISSGFYLFSSTMGIMLSVIALFTAVVMVPILAVKLGQYLYERL